MLNPECKHGRLQANKTNFQHEFYAQTMLFFSTRLEDYTVSFCGTIAEVPQNVVLQSFTKNKGPQAVVYAI